MKPEPRLADDLIIRSLETKIEKLTARVEALEARPKPVRRKAQRQRLDRDAAAFAAMAPICQNVADAYHMDLTDLRGRENEAPRFAARGEAMAACMAAGFSTPVIGRYFDGRDHSTVLHLVGRHKDRTCPPN